LKKYFISFVLIFCLLVISFYNNPKEKDTIKVAEVAHSIFYAPFYVAIHNGYFEEEGLNIELTLASGADKVTASVLSGDVDIGFCGSEATIYIYNSNEKDYLINFAGLTKKDGSFIVSRKKIKNFKLENLEDKTIIGGRTGGMPALMLSNAINKKKIKNVNIDTSIAFSAMDGAFIGGYGDFVTLFEPNALNIEKQGLGYVVASVGEISTTVPYTTFNARKSYINENKDTINKFKNAINKGLNYVHNNSSKEIAKIVMKEFNDISLEDMTKIIDRYKKIDAWYKDSNIPEKDLSNMSSILNDKELKIDYSKLVK
jgi:NitT/TauT family transport system substrate-binding protein